MVSSDRPVSLEDEVSHSMKEMIGGCCVCSDERGWAENPLVYCDGHGCSVAVHQGKHPTAARPNRACSQPSPLPPPGRQLPAPPAPAPAPPRPVPRPGVDSAGPRRGWAVCVGESACGLDCHVIRRSLSQVSFGRRLRPDPGGLGDRGAVVGGGGRGAAGGGGARAASGLAPRGSVASAVGWHVEAPPP